MCANTNDTLTRWGKLVLELYMAELHSWYFKCSLALNLKCKWDETGKVEAFKTCLLGKQVLSTGGIKNSTQLVYAERDFDDHCCSEQEISKEQKKSLHYRLTDSDYKYILDNKTSAQTFFSPSHQRVLIDRWAGKKRDILVCISSYKRQEGQQL